MQSAPFTIPILARHVNEGDHVLLPDGRDVEVESSDWCPRKLRRWIITGKYRHPTYTRAVTLRVTCTGDTTVGLL